MSTVNTINDLMKVKGEVDKANNEYIRALEDMDINIKRKAHKALGIFMARHGGSMIVKSFGKWKLLAKSLTRRHLMV